MIVYLGLGKGSGFSGAGLFYGHPRQLLIQLGAAATVIVWDGLVTFLLLKGIGLFMKLRAPDEDLEIGDVAFHGEEAYPSDELALAGVSSAQAAERASSNSSIPQKVAEKDG
jgi:ammonium transporter, Amt family